MTYTDKNKIPDFLLNSRFRIHRHILLQLVILALTINMSLDGDARLFRNTTATLSWFSYYLLINGIIYINLYILTPRYLEKEKYQKYFLGAVGLIFLTLFGITALQAIFYRFKGIKELNDTSLILLNFASSTLSIGLMLAGTSALLLLRHWMNHTRRIGELEANTLQSELQHLKRRLIRTSFSICSIMPMS